MSTGGTPTEEEEVKYLRPKYLVYRVSESGIKVGEEMESTDPNDPDSPFVLLPRKDPAAFHALLVYAAVCEHELGAEIRVWLRKIAEEEPFYGSQGLRNIKAMKIAQLEQL